VIVLERTFDYDLVRRIVTHPKIYPHISDDNSPKAEDWQPFQSEVVWYILVKLDDAPAGVFTFTPHNAVCYEVHTCLLPAIYGKNSVLAGIAVIQWMFANSPCRRIITNVPSYNILALRFAHNGGLKEFGVNEKSYLKNGVLFDQIMLGVTKEDSCR
jgi:RimJ/RimL family protein N-acetyltransferase